MFPQPEASLSTTQQARRTHDANAYQRSVEPARHAAAALLSALLGNAPPGEIERRSRAVLDAVGMLWETSARLNER